MMQKEMWVRVIDNGIVQETINVVQTISYRPVGENDSCGFEVGSEFSDQINSRVYENDVLELPEWVTALNHHYTKWEFLHVKFNFSSGFTVIPIDGNGDAIPGTHEIKLSHYFNHGYEEKPRVLGRYDKMFLKEGE